MNESSDGQTCELFAADCGDLLPVLEVEGEEPPDGDVVQQRLQPEVVVQDEGVGRSRVLHSVAPIPQNCEL